MKIVRIRENSIAEELDLRPGDDLIHINNHPLRDRIDVEYWIHDEDIVLGVSRNHQQWEIEIDGILEGPLGVEFEAMKPTCCGNTCVFCFVDQNPPGVRSSLLVKDEDYRLSFLYGNYVTLTTLSTQRLQRILDQRLSPLYISVHATDLQVRKQLLGIRRDDRLMEKLSRLARHGIEMHTQIVLCPGYNDGTILEDTVNTLSRFFPAIQTLAVVPVGLTGHRQGLEPLRGVTVSESDALIDWAEQKGLIFQRQLGTRFVFLADEFYLMANRALPSAAYYEGFHQIENGVGLTRDFLDHFEMEQNTFPSSIPEVTLNLVTGELVAPVFRRFVLPRLEAIEGLTVQLQVIKNRFLGGAVTVSGLLAAQDIVAQQSGQDGQVMALPPDCLNDDRVFLDDWTLEELSNATRQQVIVPTTGFQEMLDELNTGQK
jgi:putative radical SAM enzyme (TIGR03279 family)